jgi:hypothetical protein
MGIGGIGYPDVNLLLSLLTPVSTQEVQELVEDALHKENEMTEKLMRLSVKLRVEGLGENVDLYA